MANNLNRCEFIGNVGKVETRYMQNGKAVTKISLAVNEVRTNKDGVKEGRTTWINLVSFEKLAEIVKQYVNVGDKLFVSGKMRISHWTDDQTGKEVYKTEIIMNEMEMLGSKKQQSEPHRDNVHEQYRAPQAPQVQQPPQQVQQSPRQVQQPQTTTLEDNWDRDIPF